MNIVGEGGEKNKHNGKAGEACWNWIGNEI